MYVEKVVWVIDEIDDVAEDITENSPVGRKEFEQIYNQVLRVLSP